MKHEGWTSLELSQSQVRQLDRYEELLRDLAIPRGLIASSDVHDLRSRHILDSLRAAPLVPGDASRVSDLGSGAGLPGIPLAIALPRVEFTLAESRRTRAAFLELVVEKLGLVNARVSPRPAEQLPQGFDVCLARGFADPSGAWAVGAQLLRLNGLLLYWAGASFELKDVPDGVRAWQGADPALESGGPVVIMTRQ